MAKNYSESPFIQQNLATHWWAQSHNVFITHVLPAVLVVSTMENLFTLATLLIMRHSIERTTRALFIAIAVIDLFNLFLWYGVSMFGDHGLRSLTSGAFYLRFLTEIDAVCKSVRALNYLGLFCSNWLYVLVNIDRVVAVIEPHRSQRCITPSRLLMLFCSVLACGLLCAVFSVIMYRVKASAALPGVYL